MIIVKYLKLSTFLLRLMRQKYEINIFNTFVLYFIYITGTAYLD